MPSQINIRPGKKSPSLLDSIGSAASTLGTIAGAVNGATSLAEKFKAPDPGPIEKGASEAAALPASEPIQSQQGGTLTDVLTAPGAMKRYYNRLGLRDKSGELNA